jgi:DNA-binding CsgD family transcriptional regulator
VQDFLATTGVGTGMRGLSIAANTGGHPPATYSDEQARLAASVGPDVQRAIALHIKSSAGGQILSATPSYASMTLPVLAIHERFVLTANAPAQQELDRGRLLRSQGGRLVAQDPELARMLVAVARQDENHQMSMVATATDGSRFLAQAVRFNQLRGSLMAAAGADDPAVMLVLTSLDQGTAGREAAIRALGSFTPVEHAIAMALVNGQSIEDIARERRASVQTIRWHLRNMSDKTGQSGSKGLTRMLTLLLPY